MSLAPRLRWSLVLGWMAVIFAASAQPDSGQQSGALVQAIVGLVGAKLTAVDAAWWHHLLRKGAHFTEYAILAGLTAYALPPGRWRWGVAWAIATGYAATDELHQAFVPNRGPAVADVMIDSSGAAVAMGLAWCFARWRA